MTELKRYEEAEKEYREVIRINPDDAEAHYNLGFLYYVQKDYNKALQEFEIALKLSPNNQDIQYKIKLLRQMILKER